MINNFPYYKLLQYIKYKAEMLGILVLEVGEANTSITCPDCSHKSKKNREKQGLFKCIKCGKEMNADENGAKNILRRGLGVLSRLGGFLTYPEVIPQQSEQIVKPSMNISDNRKMELSSSVEPHTL